MKSIKALTQQVTAAAAGLRERKSALVNEREELVAQRHALTVAPLPVEDVKQFIVQMIDRQADDYAEKVSMKRVMDRTIYPPSHKLGTSNRPWSGALALNLRDLDNAIAGQSYDFADGIELVNPANAKELNGALCFFFRDEIKGKLRELLDDRPSRHAVDDIPHVGLAVAERRAKIAEINRRLQQIGDECTEVDGQLRALGKSAPAADLIVPQEQHATRDAAIVSRMATMGGRYQAAEYGITADYAAYLRRRIP